MVSISKLCGVHVDSLYTQVVGTCIECAMDDGWHLFVLLIYIVEFCVYLVFNEQNNSMGEP